MLYVLKRAGSMVSMAKKSDALDDDNLYQQSVYVRFLPSKPKIEITWEKEAKGVRQVE